jgi:hypothetical protein
MTATFTTLLFAHVLADFVLQTNWMIARKGGVGMAAHIAVVLATAIALTGSLHPALFALTAVHLGFDLAKTRLAGPGPVPFIADQAAHLASLFAVALWAPGLWAAGVWAMHLPATIAALLPSLMALAAGFILATRAGGFAVGILMAPWVAAAPQGLPGGGRVIGLLERGLIFVLILAGQPAAVGFLIAAKSVLRYEATREDQKAAEYVIIGTLASFGWAVIVAYGTLALLAALPPLGIPPASP